MTITPLKNRHDLGVLVGQNWIRGQRVSSDISFDEPSAQTMSGLPCCERCGHAMSRRWWQYCKACRMGTRLLLTDDDRAFLKSAGIKARKMTLSGHGFAAELTCKCECGSGLEPRILGCCAECATANDVNAYLFVRGLRETP